MKKEKSPSSDKTFLEWLKKHDPKMYGEVATSTADVAVFARPLGGQEEPIRRTKKSK